MPDIGALFVASTLPSSGSICPRSENHRPGDRHRPLWRKQNQCASLQLCGSPPRRRMLTIDLASTFADYVGISQQPPAACIVHATPHRSGIRFRPLRLPHTFSLGYITTTSAGNTCGDPPFPIRPIDMCNFPQPSSLGMINRNYLARRYNLLFNNASLISGLKCCRLQDT